VKSKTINIVIIAITALSLSACSNNSVSGSLSGGNISNGSSSVGPNPTAAPSPAPSQTPVPKQTPSPTPKPSVAPTPNPSAAPSPNPTPISLGSGFLNCESGQSSITRNSCLSDETAGLVLSCSCCVYHHPDGTALSGCQQPVSSNLFSMNMVTPGSTMANWPNQVGAKIWRSFDARWNRVETKAGVYDWSIPDAEVAEASAHSLQLQYVVMGTPTLYSESTAMGQGGYATCPSYYTGLAYNTDPAAFPAGDDCHGWTYPVSAANDTAWMNYVRALATRYNGKVFRYELWNEIDGGDYSGNMADLARINREAYQIIKSINPQNIVITPTDSDPLYISNWATVIPGNNLSGYFAATSALNKQYGETGPYADAIGSHYYYENTRGPDYNSTSYSSTITDVFAYQVSLVMGAAIQYGYDGLPLYNTETGWWLGTTDPTNTNSGVTDAVAADFAARAYILAPYYGMVQYGLYAWNASPFTLTNSDGSLDLQAQAYQKVETWLVGSTPLSCSSSGGLYTCTYQVSSNVFAYYVWAYDGATHCFVPSSSWNINNADELIDPVSTCTSNGQTGYSIGGEPLKLTH
jgi:hypothetical protein